MEADEFGELGYAVIDVEALMLGAVKVVEQVACVIMSASTGSEIFAEKHMVYQPFNAEGLSKYYSHPVSAVQNAIAGYTCVTHDNPVHDNPMVNPPWNAVRNRIRKILTRRAIRIYAKGAALERTVFGSSMAIQDLEDFNCPKYPGAVHDPLLECRFFAQYIPELRSTVRK